MHRNLDRRVEVLVKLPSPAEVEEVGRLLDLAFDEHTAGWELDSERHLDPGRSPPTTSPCATSRSSSSRRTGAAEPAS